MNRHSPIPPGRPSVEIDTEQLVQMLADRVGIREIAATFQCNPRTISKRVRDPEVQARIREIREFARTSVEATFQQRLTLFVETCERIATTCWQDHPQAALSAAEKLLSLDPPSLAAMEAGEPRADLINRLVGIATQRRNDALRKSNLENNPRKTVGPTN